MYNLAMPSPLFSFAFAFSFTMIGSASSLAALQSDIGFMFHPVQAILIKHISKAADRMSVDPPPTKLATSIFTATSKMLSSIWPTLLKKTYIIFNLTNCVRENVYIQLTNSDGDRYTKEQAPFRKLKNYICKLVCWRKHMNCVPFRYITKLQEMFFKPICPIISFEAGSWDILVLARKLEPVSFSPLSLKQDCKPRSYASSKLQPTNPACFLQG